jgi:hypothetical protein
MIKQTALGWMVGVSIAFDGWCIRKAEVRS